MVSRSDFLGDYSTADPDARARRLPSSRGGALLKYAQRRFFWARLSGTPFRQDVRLGSLTDIDDRAADVRFTLRADINDLGRRVGSAPRAHMVSSRPS